jgi:hypothetical protein
MADFPHLVQLIDVLLNGKIKVIDLLLDCGVHKIDSIGSDSLF